MMVGQLIVVGEIEPVEDAVDTFAGENCPNAVAGEARAGCD